MPSYKYAWAVGHDVPLVSLVNVEVDLRPYTQPRAVAPTSQPLELFPIRTTAMSGLESGEGALETDWTFNVLPHDAFVYVLETYFTVSGADVVTRDMTIVARDDKFRWARYNARMKRHIVGDPYRYDRGYAIDIVLRFSDLVRLGSA